MTRTSRGPGRAPFTWSAGDLDREGAVRGRYLDALRRADAGDYTPLLEFVRGEG